MWSNNSVRSDIQNIQRLLILFQLLDFIIGLNTNFEINWFKFPIAFNELQLNQLRWYNTKFIASWLSAIFDPDDIEWNEAAVFCREGASHARGDESALTRSWDMRKGIPISEPLETKLNGEGYAYIASRTSGSNVSANVTSTPFFFFCLIIFLLNHGLKK